MSALKIYEKKSSEGNNYLWLLKLSEIVIIAVPLIASTYGLYSDDADSIFYKITGFFLKYGLFIVLVFHLIIQKIKKLNKSTTSTRVLVALRRALYRYRDEIFEDSVGNDDRLFELNHRITVFKWVDKLDINQCPNATKEGIINGKSYNENTGRLQAICRSTRQMHLREISCFVCCSEANKLYEGFVGHVHKTNDNRVRDISFDLRQKNNKKNRDSYARLTNSTPESVQGLVDSDKNIPRSIAGFNLRCPDNREYVVILDSVDANAIPDDFVLGDKYASSVNAIRVILEALE